MGVQDPARPRGAHARAAPTHASREPRGDPAGRAARRGGDTRADQALELVRTQPGITIPEIAEAMGIEPNYLYRVMPRLVAGGQVKREGQGWHPA